MGGQQRGTGIAKRHAAAWALGVTLVAIALAAPPTGAAAATPHQIGAGDQVRVAMSPDGTAHLVWTAHSPDRYVYCRVPPGADACDRMRTWTSSSGGTIAFPAGVFALSDSRIVIAQYWCCFDETWEVASTDGGQTFAARTLLADSTSAVPGTGESVFGPGNAITALEGSISTFGPYVQSSPLGAVNSTSTSALSGGEVGDSSLGFIGPRAVLAWSAGDVDALRYRVAGGGDLNKNASWGPIRLATSNADGFGSVNVASGPSGLFMLSEASGTGAPVVRRWTGSEGSDFGPPTKLAQTGRFSELSQDPSGGLHAVWYPNVSPGDMLYRYSANGSSWGPVTTVVAGANTSNAQPVANARGEGMVAYDAAGGVVSFVRLEPPPPKPGKSVNVETVKGTVKTKCKGDRRYTRLPEAEQIPVGCLVDTSRGTVSLTSSKGRVGGTQSGRFRGGIFRVTQKAAKRPYTGLKLAGSLGCRRRAAAPRTADEEKGRHHHRHGRRLWGSGHGRFRTRGRRGDASVRGTTWFVEDRCNGSTLFTVSTGVVKVRDFAKHKTVTLRKGQRYVAKKQRR